MEGHRVGTTSLNLVCSHQKIPGEERAPGAVWTVKGRAKVAALEYLCANQRIRAQGSPGQSRGRKIHTGCKAEAHSGKQHVEMLLYWSRQCSPRATQPTGSTESAGMWRAGRVTPGSSLPL